MQRLPRIRTEQIPGTRKVSSNTELQQYWAGQGLFWKTEIPKWVQDTATQANKEILDAGNPRYSLTEIDGTTGKTRRWSRGHPGGIGQARTAVRVRYTANALAQAANSLRPILTDVIKKRFPNSRMNRLARDWLWWIVRTGGEKQNRSRAELLGGSVNTDVEIYDTLYLAPEGPDPARYAFFANWMSKRLAVVKGPRIRKRTGLPYKTRSDASAAPKDRRSGFLGEAVRRMRGKRIAGMVVWGMFIDEGLSAGYSRRTKGRGKLPVIGISFSQRLSENVGVNN